jgi:hypothetical protein
MLATLVLVAGCSSSPVCGQSIDEYCKTAVPACLRNWAQFPVDTQATCSTFVDGVWASSVPCGGYNVAFIGGVDTSTHLYYDEVTGELVAAIFYDANRGSRICAGGSATFHEPMTCDLPSSNCSDAAVD